LTVHRAFIAVELPRQNLNKGYLLWLTNTNVHTTSAIVSLITGITAVTTAAMRRTRTWSRSNATAATRAAVLKHEKGLADLPAGPFEFLPRGYRLFVAIGYAAFGKVVGREFDIDAVTDEYADPVPAHSARDRRKDNMVAVVDLYLKKCVGLFIYHHPA
jgi:hypothetical protein